MPSNKLIASSLNRTIYQVAIHGIAIVASLAAIAQFVWSREVWGSIDWTHSTGTIEIPLLESVTGPDSQVHSANIKGTLRVGIIIKKGDLVSVLVRPTGRDFGVWIDKSSDVEGGWQVTTQGFASGDQEMIDPVWTVIDADADGIADRAAIWGPEPQVFSGEGVFTDFVDKR